MKLNSILIAAITGSTLLFSSGIAEAARPPLDDLRARLMRMHIRLEAEAQASPVVLDAYRAAGEAYSRMYTLRQNVLVKLHQQPEYLDLRLAMYHTQRKLDGVREEIPARIQSIMTSATDVLSIRMQITRLERDVLEADAAYVEARDHANALNAEHRAALRDALDSIRTNPEFLALSEELRRAQESYTSVRTTAR